MVTMQYLTGDGWQWITYNGMMPVGKDTSELYDKLEKFGWCHFSEHRASSNEQRFQVRIVKLGA